MEEIDNIIINTLRNLVPNFEEDVTTLRQFDVELVVRSISTCLETIIPGSSFSKFLPPTMTGRLKLASLLAQQVKELGFQDDLGYQTILYHNETEMRRLLMFLIERLPREESTFMQSEKIGYVPRLVSEIEKRIKESLTNLWLPSAVLDRGVRPTDEGFEVNSFGDSVPFEIKKLRIPSTINIVNEAQKHYYVHCVPEVTKQCLPHELIPSLLFKDNEFNKECLKVVSVNNEVNVGINNSDTQDGTLKDSLKEPPKVLPEQSIVTQTQYKEKNEGGRLEALKLKYEENKAKYTEAIEKLNAAKENLKKVEQRKLEEEENLKSTMNKLKIKTKTMTILNNPENLQKLKTVVEQGDERLAELENKWKAMQSELFKEYESLQTSVTTHELKHGAERTKLENIKSTYSNLLQDLSEKQNLEQILMKKCNEISSTNNRSAYTRRILEIIGNIKKQQKEIEKILKDTHNVQKDINNLTGQIDRSFTLSDEIIFQNAKQDEASRRAYKILASLRNECSDIVKAISALGLAERESRNIQEQVDLELAKETGVKLERVARDLEEIRRENLKILAPEELKNN